MSNLISENKSGWENADDELRGRIYQFSQEYMDFLNQSKTEREIVENAKNIAISNGFRDINEYPELHAGDKVYYVNR